MLLFSGLHMKNSVFILFLVAVAFCGKAIATDCFTDCRKACTSSVRYPCGIGKWCDKDIVDGLCNARCNTERTVHCRTSINSCSFWRGNPYFHQTVEAIRLAHRQNVIGNVHQCHRIVSRAESASSAAGAAQSIYTVASKGVEAWWGALSVTSIGSAEMVKHLARCACTSAY